MSVLTKAAALLETASPADLDAMRPADRQRFIDLMRRWQAIAEDRLRHGAAPKSGIRAQLANGERAP